MRKKISVILLVLLAAGQDSALAKGVGFEYPCYVVNAHDSDGDGLYGMDPNGNWWPRVQTDPNIWLVGPPLSDKSAVSLPTDHWVELQFRGPITDGSGYDIQIMERGQVDEDALVFLTDGRGREFLLDRVTALDEDTGDNFPTYIQLDIAGVDLPFAPRAVRVVGLDKGGACLGFDLMNVVARICTECDGYAACNPIPVYGARRVAPDAQLSWSPGTSAQRHIVYFGTSPDDVGPDAEPVSFPPQGQDANSFDPGPLELNTTYYWRVDEVNGTSPQTPHVGQIWSFETATGLVIDDFERYQTSDNPELPPQLGSSWETPFYEIYIALNMGKDLARGQSKSMWLRYDILGSYVPEATRIFDEPQDWAGHGIEVLELYFRGTSDSGTGVEMYLSLFDGQRTATVPYDGSPNDLTVEQWQRWAVNLDEFSGINLSTIEKLSIGFTDTDPGSSIDDSGVLYIDDIGVYPVRCVEELQPDGDCTGDCVVDYRDVEEMADSWLEKGRNVYPVAIPNEPVLWYQFEGNWQDSGPQGRLGQPVGNPGFVPGFHGQGIKLGGDDGVDVIGARYMFGAMSDAITIAFWQKGANSGHDRDTLCCSDYAYGVKNPTVAVNLGCWKRPGRYFWHCGSQWNIDNQVDGLHEGSREWTSRWNHWAFTKDINAGEDPNKGEMKVFLNGVLVESRAGAIEPIGNVESFTIGTGWYGGYDGVMDEFRIYDYALSAKEIAFVATNGTGVFNLPLLSPLDLMPDDAIDFLDFAVLADNWLASGLPPADDQN